MKKELYNQQGKTKASSMMEALQILNKSKW